MTDNLSKSLKSTEHELSWANRGLKANNVDDGNLSSLIELIQNPFSFVNL